MVVVVGRGVWTNRTPRAQIVANINLSRPREGFGYFLYKNGGINPGRRLEKGGHGLPDHQSGWCRSPRGVEGAMRLAAKVSARRMCGGGPCLPM